MELSMIDATSIRVCITSISSDYFVSLRLLPENDIATGYRTTDRIRIVVRPRDQNRYRVRVRPHASTIRGSDTEAVSRLSVQRPLSSERRGAARERGLHNHRADELNCLARVSIII